MKASITYKCDTPGHQMRAVMRAEVRGDRTHVAVKFDPPISDKTTDPTGLLQKFIGMIQLLKSENE